MTTFPFSLLMTSTLMISSLMAMSSTNWLFMWLALEINMMSFIPLMMMSQSNQETESSIKYFLIQALGSSMMLMFSMTMWYFSIMTIIMSSLLMMSLMIKMGAVPFHPWFPQVMSGLSWMNCLLLSTWQKLAPLAIVSFMFMLSPLLLLFAPLTALLGGFMGMNQPKLRTLMAYSSMVHMGWILMLPWVGQPNLAMIYFAVYSLLACSLFIMFQYMNSDSISQTSKSMNISPKYSIYTSFLLLSLSGLPPFLGFFMKWASIMVLYKSPSLTLILISASLMSTYYYLNLIFSSLMSMKQMQTLSITKNPSKPTLFCLSTTLLPVMLLMWM